MYSENQTPFASTYNYYDGIMIPIVVLAILAFFVLLIIIIEISTAATIHSIARNHPKSAPQKNGFLKRFFIYLAVAVIVLYIAQAIDCITNKTNKDGWINPFSRTARTDNVSVKQSLEFNLSDNYTVHPYYDIKNLEITVYFLDSYNRVITTKAQYFKDVKAKTDYKFSFNISDFSASDIFSIYTWRYDVTGGTISYSANISTGLSSLN